MTLTRAQVQTPTGTPYFLDNVSKALGDQLKHDPISIYTQKVNLFYRKNLHQPLDVLSELSSWFSRSQQPTRSQVKAAMILTVDDDYSIKAGGGAISDNLFSSSLKWLQAHPVTGEDIEPVLIKKHSTCFEDVLITWADIEYLINNTLTPHQHQSKEVEYVEGVVLMLHRGYHSGRINTQPTGKRQIIQETFTDTHVAQLVKLLHTPARRAIASQQINQHQNAQERFLSPFLSGENGISDHRDYGRVDPVATALHIAQARKQITAWDTVRKAVLGEVTRSKSKSVQLGLF